MQALLNTKAVSTGAPIITRFTVTVKSTAGTILFKHLRTGHHGTADLAEHQSIAWALTDPDQDSVLVTQDKHAAILALAELGNGRVCHPYELWDQLQSQGHLSDQQLSDLMDATSRRDRSIPAIPWRMQRRE
jgi:hypothetical protein